MRGITETVFLRQWGIPEIKASLNDLKSFFALDFLMVEIGVRQNEFVAAWIYKKRDRVFFFKGEKLISHFKWSQFKTRFRKSDRRGFGSHDAYAGSGVLTERNPLLLGDQLPNTDAN